MKRFIAIVSILIMAMACNHSTPKIIPEAKMVRVIWDVMQADEFAGSFIAKDSSKNLKLERMKLYKQVFALHQVSEKEYFSSFKYYTSRPDIFKRVIDSLSDRATRAQQAIHTPAQTPPAAAK